MRLRVGAKLTLGFGAVMGLASVIVVVALVRLASLDAVIDEITSKGLPRVELMHAIVDQAGNLTRDSQAILLATNSAARGQQMIQFNRSRAALGELLGKFDEVLAASGKDNDSIDDRLHAATSDYLVSAIRFTRIIDNKNLAPERAQLAAALEFKHATLVDVLQKYSAQETAYSHVLNTKARELYASGTRTLTILTLIAALIAVIFVWWLTRSISTNLRHAVSIATAISAGKLDNEIIPDDRDEAGEMLAALKLMQANLFESFHNLEQHNHELAVVTELSNLLQTAADLKEAAQILSRMVGNALAPHAGAIYLTSSSLNRLDCIAQWGEKTLARMITPEECLALRRGRAYGASHPDHEVYCTHVALSTSSQPYVCVPMMTQGTSLGMLHVLFNLRTARTDELTGAHLRVQRLADQIALALANLKLRETLRDQSTRDVLTGLFNRRYLEESLEREFARAQREKLPLAVFMLDVDHFKRFNDTHGHAAGDTMLRALGRTLNESTRAGDLVCRYGGEEFTAVLPGATVDQATEWAKRLMNRVRTLTAVSDGQTLSGTTISMGLACYPGEHDSIQSLIHAADVALYEAKRAGRDRLVVAGTAEIGNSATG